MKKPSIRNHAKKIISCLEHYHFPPILVFGNGGSAATANHMECDWTKSTDGKLVVHSLSSNPSMLTAIGNDVGYDNTAILQIQWWKHVIWNPVVILISASGTSPNIVKAAEYCHKKYIPIIGFSGCTGGPLKRRSDVSVHIDSNDYGVIEDYHSQVMHEVVRQLRKQINDSQRKIK